MIGYNTINYISEKRKAMESKKKTVNIIIAAVAIIALFGVGVKVCSDLSVKRRMENE